ncbi:DMT family transporter [Blastomonas sp. AAP53]|uniref:DMT family transporter n=1 Tax=Blastomonas sp. AAP53 TaxID=1248760 RepID=UPI000303C2D4|nr:DMT family transporter [Blastomonas sp. AAP53]
MALPEPQPAPVATPASSPPANQALVAIVIRLFAAISITAMFACVKLASNHGVHVLESVFYRQLTGVLVLIPVAVAGPGMALLRTSIPWTHAGRMVIGMVAMSLNFLSFALLPIAEATAIGFMVPIIATLLSIFLLHETVGLHRWGAIAAGLAGVLIVVQPGSGHIPLAGALVGIAGVAITAWVSIIIRKLGETESPVTTMFWFSLSSMIPLGIAMLFVGKMHDAETWAIIGLMGLFGAGAQLGITWSLRLAPVSVVLPMDYSSLIWAALAGWLIWENWPVPATWIGAPLIIGSGLYIAWRENQLARQRRG